MTGAIVVTGVTLWRKIIGIRTAVCAMTNSILNALAFTSG